MAKNSQVQQDRTITAQNTTHRSAIEWIEVGGYLTYSAELAAIFGQNSYTVNARIRRGWPVMAACLAKPGMGLTINTAHLLESAPGQVEHFQKQLDIYFAKTKSSATHTAAKETSTEKQLQAALNRINELEAQLKPTKTTRRSK